MKTLLIAVLAIAQVICLNMTVDANVSNVSSSPVPMCVESSETDNCSVNASCFYQQFSNCSDEDFCQAFCSDASSSASLGPATTSISMDSCFTEPATTIIETVSTLSIMCTPSLSNEDEPISSREGIVYSILTVCVVVSVGINFCSCFCLLIIMKKSKHKFTPSNLQDWNLLPFLYNDNFFSIFLAQELSNAEMSRFGRKLSLVQNHLTDGETAKGYMYSRNLLYYMYHCLHLHIIIIVCDFMCCTLYIESIDSNAAARPDDDQETDSFPMYSVVRKQPKATDEFLPPVPPQHFTTNENNYYSIANEEYKLSETTPANNNDPLYQELPGAEIEVLPISAGNDGRNSATNSPYGKRRASLYEVPISVNAKSKKKLIANCDDLNIEI